MLHFREDFQFDFHARLFQRLGQRTAVVQQDLEPPA